MPLESFIVVAARNIIKINDCVISFFNCGLLLWRFLLTLLCQRYRSKEHALVAWDALLESLPMFGSLLVTDWVRHRDAGFVVAWLFLSFSLIHAIPTVGASCWIDGIPCHGKNCCSGCALSAGALKAASILELFKISQALDQCGFFILNRRNNFDKKKNINGYY